MTIRTDDSIRAFLADDARRALVEAPSLDQAVRRLAPRVGERPSGVSQQRLIILLAATLLLVAALGAAIAVGNGILRLPLVIDVPDIAPMLNGRIVQADGGYWLDDTAPPPPGGAQNFTWDAFDQETGSFLYSAPGLEDRVWVVGEDGLVAEVNCPSSSVCDTDAGGTFGPGPDEITMPSSDRRSVDVIGLDGTLRDTLDISVASTSPGQDLLDLAWSPDGNRLAVSTEPEFSTQPERGCDRSTGPCGGRVWIFDRDGGGAQLVHNEGATVYTVFRDLAWSPGGDTLALLVGPSGFCGAPPEQAWPRLVALQVAPGEPVLAETLNVYDDYPREMGCILYHNYNVAFPFAWSPDGTRIAVTKADGITEISAENGEVLARHPGEWADGPLAWLAER